APADPILLSGRFEGSGLFQLTLLPNHFEQTWRATIIGALGQAELVFENGWPGHCRLTYRDETGKQREETWEAWNPWPAVVEAFEAATTAQPRPSPLTPRPSPLTPYPSPLVPHPSPLPWNHEIPSLELDHAALRPRGARRAPGRGRLCAPPPQHRAPPGQLARLSGSHRRSQLQGHHDAGRLWLDLGQPGHAHPVVLASMACLAHCAFVRRVSGD